jgi:NAD(P)-dependent dehydrogenase (short-subunit alcohol dehydrogenase family)
MDGLEGLRVLVTGAAGGIGGAVVERLAEQGSAIAAVDVLEPDLPAARVRLAADVADEHSVARAVADARGALGGLDALVLAAGIAHVGPTHDLTTDEFDRVLGVNVRGTFLCIRAALPAMLEQRSGRIVTFGSTAALVGAPGLSAYAAAKGAVLQLTRSVGAEYAARGIRANCLCPGATDTTMLRRLQEDRPDPQAFARAHPIGRYAEPHEIAGVVAFLLSDEASYFAGSTVVCDGGFTAV